jgi:hypothetical protein
MRHKHKQTFYQNFNPIDKFLYILFGKGKLRARPTCSAETHPIMNMDKAVFRNLITSPQSNPIENTMLGDLLHTFFAFTTRVITTVRDVE